MAGCGKLIIVKLIRRRVLRLIWLQFVDGGLPFVLRGLLFGLGGRTVETGTLKRVHTLPLLLFTT